MTADSQNPLTVTYDLNGVAWLTIDVPDRKVNLLSEAVLDALPAWVAQLESRVSGGRLKCLVIRSGKPGNFCSGADVATIAAVTDRDSARRAASAGHRAFQRLASLNVPTIAAVDGTCLGGGAELALTCDWIVGSDAPHTTIGLPEVGLGIIPGFGGCIRLPRRVGIRRALKVILGGRVVDAADARAYGWFDRVFSADGFYDHVAGLAGDIADGREKPFPRRSGRGRGGLLDRTALGRKVLFRAARRDVMERTNGKYPAPLRAIEVIQGALGRHDQEAAPLEIEAVADLITTPEARGLLRLFLARQAAGRGLTAEELDSAPAVGRVAVIGAGVMGSGIAWAAGRAGIEVQIKDIDRDQLAAGLQRGKARLQRAVAGGRLTGDQARETTDLVTVASDYDDLADADLVIEAVKERMDVKRMVLRDTEAVVPTESVFATNTSALSVSELAQSAEWPGRVVGLHFFNPVHKMPLVEVVRGEQTSQEALAAGFKLVKAMRKVPVIVKDSPGFVVNRVLAPYLNEVGYLLADGATVREIDETLEEFGMPMGPCRVLDEVGLDVAASVSERLGELYRARMTPSPGMERLRADGRLGRKVNRGFYRYSANRDPQPDIHLESLFRGPQGGSRVARAPRAAEIRSRCLLPMVNEAVRVLDEGVLVSGAILDLTMVMGSGFPPFRGGILQWADTQGPAAVFKALGDLAEKHGERFEPGSALSKLVADGQRFGSL